MPSANGIRSNIISMLVIGRTTIGLFLIRSRAGGIVMFIIFLLHIPRRRSNNIVVQINSISSEFILKNQTQMQKT